MRKLATLLSFLLAISVAHAQPINSFVIDTFDNTPGTAADPTLNANGVWTGYGPGIPDVLGGHRVLGNYLTQVGAGTNFTNKTIIDADAGFFTIDNPVNTRSSGQVIWQGNSTAPGTNPIVSHPAGFNLGNVNFDTLLSTSGFYFQWSVINADSRDWTYTVRAYTNDASNYFEGTLTSDLSGVNLSIAKVNFTAVGSPTWTDIDALSFSANYTGGLLGGDLAIDFMQLAVPEMSTYMMLTLMLLLIGAYRVFRSGPAVDKKEQAEEKDAQTTPELTPATVTV